MQAHFSALQPTSVRLLTEKTNPARSRGIAFVEFADFARMKTCLAKFHHTEFPDPSGEPRRINVELTAGGGGNKSEGRQEKIRAKNAKLNEERARRMAAEEEAKRAKKDGGTDKKEDGGAGAGGEEGGEAREELEEGWIHPSRRAHVPGRENDYQSQEVPETSTGGDGGGFGGGRFRGGGGRGGGGRGGRGGRGGGKRGAPRGRRS